MNAFRFNSLPVRSMALLFAISAGAPTLAASSACQGTGETQVAGNVIYSQGAVEAQTAGQARPLVKGAPVCVGDMVVTSPSARVQIKMADGGLIGVRPGTKMKIEAFRFNGKEDGTETSTIALLEGGFRALTGQIGHSHKENYRITTPTAIIGIRGTDHEPMYIPSVASGQAAAGEPGTYDKVNSGGVAITTPQGVVEVHPNQVGFAPDVPGATPLILKDVPHFYHPGADTEQSGFGPEASRGVHETGEGSHDHLRNNDRHQDRDIRAPEPRVPEMNAPDVHAPEMQHGSED